MQIGEAVGDTSRDRESGLSQWGAVRWVVLVMLGTALAGPMLSARTTLLTETPEFIHWPSYLAGLFLGGLFARLLIALPSTQPWKKPFAIVGVSIILTVACSFLGRLAFEIAAFANEPGLTYELEAPISGVQAGRSRPRAYVVALPSGGEIDILISNDVYEQLASIRPPLWSLPPTKEPFCLTLKAQRGRWGAVRALVPAIWEHGVDRFHICGTHV